MEFIFTEPDVNDCLGIITQKLSRDSLVNSFMLKLDPMSRVTGIPGWYWILGIKCSDSTGVGLVY